MTGQNAPYEEVEDAPNFDDLNPMERTISSTLHEVKDSIGADQPIEGRPRDATGKFVSVAEGQQTQAGEWVKLDDAPLVEGEAGEGDPDSQVAIPEGHVALPALAPEKVQGFRVLDADGEEIIVPDMKWEVMFRGPNGEPQPVVMDVPKLVNYARQGKYNHEREQQAITVRNENVQLNARVQEATTYARQLQQERERMLTDPNFLVAQIERYERENTPEARAQREREEINNQRLELEYQRVAQTNMNYLDNKIAPALNTISTALTHVTTEELASRLAMLIEPYKIRTPFGTILNPDATAHVEHMIINQLVPWAESVHADRTQYAQPGPKQVNTPAKTKVATDQQVKNQKLRRIATAALKPVSGNPPQGQPSSNKLPTSNRNMADFIVGKTMAGMRGG